MLRKRCHTNLIDSAKYGKEQEKKEAQDVIDRAIQLAQLANETPAGTVLDIAGKKLSVPKEVGQVHQVAVRAIQRYELMRWNY